jgi:hypothetical protein
MGNQNEKQAKAILVRRKDKLTSPLARAVLDNLDSLDKLDKVKLRNTIVEALHRFEAGHPKRDGYPGGGSGGGGELTGVESATESRVFGRGQRDPVHLQTTRAAGQLIAGVGGLLECLGALAVLAKLLEEAPLDSPACDLCIEHGLPVPRGWDTFGTVGNRLPVPRHLCNPHRWFIEDNGKPPSAEQSIHHYQRGSWKIRVAS